MFAHFSALLMKGLKTARKDKMLSFTRLSQKNDLKILLRELQQLETIRNTKKRCIFLSTDKHKDLYLPVLTGDL